MVHGPRHSSGAVRSFLASTAAARCRRSCGGNRCNLARASRRARRLASLGVLRPRPRKRGTRRSPMRSPADALCFAQVHRPLRRLLRTANRDAPGTRAGAPAEPARTSLVTAPRSALRTVRHSIAVAAPIRRLHRRQSSDLSYSANRLSDRPGRPWVSHPTQQAAGGAHAPSLRALRRPPPPLAAWLLLERAYVAPIHAKYRGPDGAGRLMSYTDMRPQRDRTRHKHGPIHDRHTAFYGCGGAPAGVFHDRYTAEIPEFAPWDCVGGPSIVRPRTLSAPPDHRCLKPLEPRLSTRYFPGTLQQAFRTRPRHPLMTASPSDPGHEILQPSAPTLETMSSQGVRSTLAQASRAAETIENLAGRVAVLSWKPSSAVARNEPWPARAHLDVAKAPSF